MALSRKSSVTLSTRVELAAAAALRAHARECGESQAVIMRRIIALALTKGGEDALATVIRALGLPEDSDRQSILAAVEALLGEGDMAPGDAMTDAAEPLTPAQLKALHRAGKPLTRAAWIELTARAARGAAPKRAPAPVASPPVTVPRILSAAEHAACDRAGVPHDQRRQYLAERAAKAARRAK